jgi:hypothetical protein
MRYLVLLSIFASSFSFGQTNIFQTWTETGTKFALNKRLSLGADWTNRIGENGFATVFPQLSFKYKVSDWFRPSIDFRYVLKKQLDATYQASGRVNFNTQFNYHKKRLSAGLRLRYQYQFSNLNSQYDSEFDKAFRIKPNIEYDINNSVISPVVSVEFFYDPNYSDLGRRFNEIRYFVGGSLDLNGPHQIQIGYMFNQKINLPAPVNKQILSLSYMYNVKLYKDKKNVKTTSTKNASRDL